MFFFVSRIIFYLLFNQYFARKFFDVVSHFELEPIDLEHDEKKNKTTIDRMVLSIELTQYFVGHSDHSLVTRTANGYGR